MKQNIGVPLHIVIEKGKPLQIVIWLSYEFDMHMRIVESNCLI